MDTRLLCTALLLSAGACWAQDLLPRGPLSGAVSGAVTFATTLEQTALPFYLVSWSFGGKKVITSSNNDAIGPGYEDRITLERSTGSLVLRKLTLADSGVYTVSIIANDGLEREGTTTLNVYVPVSGATILGPTTVLTEDKDSANVTCQASGTVSSRIWRKDGLLLYPTATRSFSADNVTVLFRPVRGYDHGSYQCQVSNPISAMTVALNLSVNFGPHNISIEGPSTAPPGSRVTLECKASSFPPATFSWRFNDNTTQVNGSVYVVQRLDGKSEGNYTCTARNAATWRENSTLLQLRASSTAPCWSFSMLAVSAASGRWFM